MIWIFGDSFSAPFDSKMNIWSTDYIKWKGYVPNVFGHMLSEKYNTEFKNFAIGGLDNDSIFESVLNNAPLIQKEDIVIIGWSSIRRFRLSSTGKDFIVFIPKYDNQIKNPDLSKSTIDEILVNRGGLAHLEEFKNRINFINWLFRDNILIQWSPFETKYFTLPKKYNTITKETNGEVLNHHYSETGHNELSEYFITLIENESLRNRINVTSNNLI